MTAKDLAARDKARARERTKEINDWAARRREDRQWELDNYWDPGESDLGSDDEQPWWGS